MVTGTLISQSDSEEKKHSGPLARKQLMVSVLTMAGAVRAIAAYDAMQSKDPRALQPLVDTTPNDALARPLQRLLARNQTSLTKEHHAKTSDATAVARFSSNTAGDRPHSR